MTEVTRFNWDDLKLLLALAESRTVGRAAERLLIDATTITRRVRKIEDLHNIQLLERVKGGVELTEEADRLVLVARQTGDALERTFKRNSDHDPISGTVRLSATDFMLDLLAKPLAKLASAHSELVLELKPSNDFLSLSQREADVAVRLGESPSDGLIGRRIGKVTLGIYNSRKSSDWGGRWIGWNLPRGETLVEAVLRKHDPKGRVVARVNSFMTQAKLVETGYGVACLPDQWVAARPDLQELRRVVDAGEEECWVLTHEELRRVPRIQAVMKHAASVLK